MCVSFYKDRNLKPLIRQEAAIKSNESSSNKAQSRANVRFSKKSSESLRVFN